MLVIHCERAEYSLCQQIPGCNFHEKTQLWRVPLSWPAYVAFREVWKFQPVLQQPELDEWAASAWQDVQISYHGKAAMDSYDPELSRFLDLADDRTPPARLEDGTEMPRRLFGYQRGGVSWLAREEKAGLFDPQGNGKTPVVIRAIEYLQDTGRTAGPAVIVCTDAMLLDWRDELAVWAPELTVSVVKGTALKRRRALEEQADIYLISWSVVRYHTRLAQYQGQAFVRCNDHGGHTDKTVAQCEVHEKELNALGLSIVVADEAHRMKDATTKQTRAVWWLMHNAQYAWPVTGTPIADNIADIWSVGHGLSPRAFPAKSRFLDLYAEVRLDWQHGSKEILDIKPDSAQSFHATVQPMFRRIPRDLARPFQPPRLPPVIRYVDMDGPQKKAYQQVEKMAMADLVSSTVVTGNDLVKFSRLCQLATAMIETSDGEDPYGFTKQLVAMCNPSNKVTDLLDFMSSEPDPVVVAANSPQVIALAGARLSELKVPWCKVTGAESTDEKHLAREQFQAGQAQVIFITKAGAESITLTAAHTIYFIQPDPSFLSREQKIGRIDRITQRAPVQPVYAITPGTVDERLYKLGNEKENRAASVTMDVDLLRWIVGGDVGQPAEAGRLF